MNRQKKNTLLPVPRLLGMPFAQGVALLYLLVAGLWIYFSDKLAQWLTETASQLRFLSTYKGWFFVAVTAGLLFLVLKRFVSKIRLAQQKLRESEDRFKIATEAGGIGVWDLDIVNDRLTWDDRMYELYGVHKEDFGGAYDAWKQCLHPDDIDRASVEVAAAERGVKPFDTEFRIIRPDNGTVRHIRAFGKVIRDKDGTPLHMIGTNQDITDHVEDEKRFRMLFETMNSCVAIYKPLANNSDFEFVDMNPIGLRSSKISREDLIGRKVTEVFPDVKASGVFGALQRVARTGTPEYLPLRHYKDERIELWVENHIFKLPSGLVVAVYEDITEKHQAEEALRKSEEEFRLTLNDLQVGVVVHHADTSILLSNPQACHLLGLTTEQIAGKTAVDPAWCFVKEDLSVMDIREYPVNQVVSTKEKLSNLTLGIRHPEQEEITWVLVSAVPVFTEQNELIRVIVNFIDITDKKLAEQELSQFSWLLEKESGKSSAAISSEYGDLTELNQNGIILHSVGRQMLKTLSDDVMDMLDTCVAVYEKNGDYAFGTFVSPWCGTLDHASRRLCQTDDNAQALSCGNWLCHDSCWLLSKEALESGEPVDRECAGGLRIYAVPIRSDDKVIGVINFGYGTPPVAATKRKELCHQYQIDPAVLRCASEAYKPRPPFIIEVAKRRLQSIARLIGEVVSRQQIEGILSARNQELERFNKAAVGRELRMIELKKEVNALCRELGKPVPYPVQNSAGHEQEST